MRARGSDELVPQDSQFPGPHPHLGPPEERHQCDTECSWRDAKFLYQPWSVLESLTGVRSIRSICMDVIFSPSFFFSPLIFLPSFLPFISTFRRHLWADHGGTAPQEASAMAAITQYKPVNRVFKAGPNSRANWPLPALPTLLPAQSIHVHGPFLLKCSGFGTPGRCFCLLLTSVQSSLPRVAFAFLPLSQSLFIAYVVLFSS